MNKQLDGAISRLRELPEERQQAAAVLVLDFLEHDDGDVLTTEQIAEIERRLDEDGDAMSEDLRLVFGIENRA